MKPPVSPDQRQHAIELRRTHSLREVASLTGLPLGTVKTLCSRSRAFSDNPVHRDLFTLPPKLRLAQSCDAI
jgi:DNA-directed RNA polymerase specialized sigma24 family protein